ncbi:MAG: alkaline phosphatase family protein, partial [Myxococcota bacterium]|nr:alkaline phosphatase family protein [Myxococcota bacterium]
MMPSLRRGIPVRACLLAIGIGLGGSWGTGIDTGTVQAARRKAAAAAPVGRPTVTIVGVDGAEWGVVEDLWSRGELPTLQKLSERGASGELATGYGARSPIVWTTVATGHEMEVHGIQDFISDAAGSRAIPVSSSDRRVKAIWNMLSERDLRVLQLGWWASWPVEEINGISLTDRVLTRHLDQRAWPVSLEDGLEAWESQAAEAYRDIYSPPNHGKEDRLFTWVATDQLSRERYDLTMVYLHRVDIVSHRYWRYYEPGPFPPMEEAELAQGRETFFDAYRAVDRSVADLLALRPEDGYLVVISDHGFYAAEEETFGVGMNITRVLEAMGLWAGAEEGGEPDWERTRVYTPDARPVGMKKKVRVNLEGREEHGSVSEEDFKRVRNEAKRELARVTWGTGEPAFLPRMPGEVDAEEADLVVKVLTDGIDGKLFYDGQEIEGAVQDYWRRSGGHSKEPPGLFFAVGPGIEPGSKVEGARIFDITPTLLT